MLAAIGCHCAIIYIHFGTTTIFTKSTTDTGSTFATVGCHFTIVYVHNATNKRRKIYSSCSLCTTTDTGTSFTTGGGEFTAIYIHGAAPAAYAFIKKGSKGSATS